MNISSEKEKIFFKRISRHSMEIIRIKNLSQNIYSENSKKSNLTQ